MSQEPIPQIPTTMRAFAIDRFGEPGTLRTLPTPEIGADEILVRVQAAGVNPIDEKIRDGFKTIGDARFPFILGQDAAGVVVRIGPNVTRFGVGSAVYGADEAALAARGICATNVDVFGTTGGLDDVARCIDEGRVTVPLARTFPLEAVVDALAAMQAGHLRGKLVLTVT